MPRSCQSATDSWRTMESPSPMVLRREPRASSPTGSDSESGVESPSADNSHAPIPPDDPYWRQPKVAALLEKMRDLGEHARRKATSKHDKRLIEKFYSDVGLRKRVQLMSHPDVVHALNTIWTAADTDGSHSIEKNEYLVMHRKLVLALDPSTKPKDAFAAAEEDWVKDSEGKRSLDKDRFFWCWFELADLWTDSMAPEAYVSFLQVR